MIPLKAIGKRLLPRTNLSMTIQPSAKVEQVFAWLTTVLDKGPAPLTMKNFDILIAQAHKPLYEPVSMDYPNNK